MVPPAFCPKCQLPSDTPDTCPQCGTTLAPDLPPTIDLPADATRSVSGMAPSPAKATAKLPEFGNYDLLEEVGRGGMGVVYKARQKRADRLVALKVMRDGAQVTEEEKMRFTAEVRALGRIHHPHIVAVYDVGEESGCPYFTMEYIEGKSLAQRLRDGAALTPAEAARLVEDLANAVQAAHDVGILHRDIKPGNILIDAQGDAKLMDFGLAKHLQQDTGLTSAGSALGTPSYMAPEQACGDLQKLGPHSDVYSLGATFYELLMGRPPFRGETAGGTLARVLQDDVVPPRKYRPQLSPELEAVCLKCLEKNPANRYASAQELAEDLQRWRNGEATRVRPWSWRRRLARKVRRHWKPIAAALFVLATAGLFFLTFVWLDPDYQANRAKSTVDRAVQSGERVVLVGRTGPPKWARQAFDSADTTLSTAPTSVFQVQTKAETLIELAPAAHHDRYRISAELRTRESHRITCSSGIYFAHNHGSPDAAGFVERVFVVRHERNLMPRGDSNKARKEDYAHINEYQVRSRDGVTELEFVINLGSHVYKVNPDPMIEKWRYLEVEVTPTALHARWRDEDGNLHLIGRRDLVRKTVLPVLVEHVQRSTTGRVKDLAHTEFKDVVHRLEYKPRGAFGLFVMHGTVDFRNVVYEPLPEEQAP